MPTCTPLLRDDNCPASASCGPRRIPAAAPQVRPSMRGMEGSNGVDQTVTTELGGHARRTRARKTREGGRRSARGGYFCCSLHNRSAPTATAGTKKCSVLSGGLAALGPTDRRHLCVSPLGHGEKTDHHQTLRRRPCSPLPPALCRKARQTIVSLRSFGSSLLYTFSRTSIT